MRDPGIVPTASDAHKIPDLATPNTELIDEYGSPRKGKRNHRLGGAAI